MLAPETPEEAMAEAQHSLVQLAAAFEQNVPAAEVQVIAANSIPDAVITPPLVGLVVSVSRVLLWIMIIGWHQALAVTFAGAFCLSVPMPCYLNCVALMPFMCPRLSEEVQWGGDA
eukprot:scaffold48482_cov21-Tisochrysis_lutea.AAC.2